MNSEFIRQVTNSPIRQLLFIACVHSAFSIKNFKIHRDTKLDLFPNTVFVGPNSGGKSSIFDALISFSMVCRGDLSEAFNQYPFSFEALNSTVSALTGSDSQLDLRTVGARWLLRTSRMAASR